MKALIIVFFCALALAGCKTEAERAAEENKRLQEQAEQNKRANEQIAAADDAQCKNYGLQIGTPAYADCRLKLQSLHLQATAMVLQALRPPVVIEQPSGPTMTRCQTNGGITDCRSY